MASFRFRCPKCGGIVETDESLMGRMARCPYCSSRIEVPIRGIHSGESGDTAFDATDCAEGKNNSRMNVGENDGLTGGLRKDSPMSKDSHTDEWGMGFALGSVFVTLSAFTATKLIAPIIIAIGAALLGLSIGREGRVWLNDDASTADLTKAFLNLITFILLVIAAMRVLSE
jgi:DNA-directed RNA polymerase subunit RPC12/RpoP